MKKNTSSKPSRSALRAATTTGALVVVLRIRQDEDGGAMERIESVMKRSGLDAAAVILRAIGLGRWLRPLGLWRTALVRRHAGDHRDPAGTARLPSDGGP